MILIQGISGGNKQISHRNKIKEFQTYIIG